jgi:hypothetical protein
LLPSWQVWRWKTSSSFWPFASPANPSRLLPPSAQGWSSVGDGWRDLLDPGGGPGRHVHATQIKEKYGTLKFYWKGALSRDADAMIDEAIDLAEACSACTCEICGPPKTVAHSARPASNTGAAPPRRPGRMPFFHLHRTQNLAAMTSPAPSGERGSAAHVGGDRINDDQANGTDPLGHLFQQIDRASLTWERRVIHTEQRITVVGLSFISLSIKMRKKGELHREIVQIAKDFA